MPAYIFNNFLKSGCFSMSGFKQYCNYNYSTKWNENMSHEALKCMRPNCRHNHKNQISYQCKAVYAIVLPQLINEMIFCCEYS